MIVGNTIGSGIFRAPGQIAGQLPTLSLYLGVWVIGGLYALLGANALAELGTLLPRSGGQYVFAREALGEYAGFVVGWSDWLSTCGSTTASAIVIAEVTRSMLHVEVMSVRAITMTLIVCVALVQWRRVRTAAGIQNFTSALKGIAFVILIAICFAAGSHPQGAQAGVRATSLLAVIIALQAVIFTYDGWTGVLYFSEEVKNPGRDIPRSMLGGVVTVLVIYLLVNIGFTRVVPLSKLAGSGIAASIVANEIFGPWGDRVVGIILVVNLLSAISACQLMASRVLFGLSRDGFFSEKATGVNAGGTPAPAHFLSAGVALALGLSGAFDRVIALLAFYFVANYTLSFLSLFVLRIRRPDAPRPYRAWGHPVTTGLALAGSVAFLVSAVWSDRANSLGALLLLAATVPIFGFVSWRRRRARAE